MLVDFQQHYTPPELLKGNADAVSVQVDQDGNPNYLLNPLLADLTAHIRVMDAAGIDAGVLSCGSGFDQPDLATCRLINDRMREAERAHPGRFIGLALVPALSSARSFRTSRSTPRHCGRSGNHARTLVSTSSSIRCRASSAGAAWMPTISAAC